MILGTVMILHAAQTTKVSMQEKSKAKAVCEITQDTYQLSSQDISAAAQLPHVTFLNRHKRLNESVNFPVSENHWL